jgi:hypothetical protein
MEQEKLDKVNFDDEETTCPKCGAYGQYIPPSKEVDDTIVATFKCNNGHFFKRKYPLKDQPEQS